MFCFLRSTRGSALPAGKYAIQGPMQRPSCGPLAIMLNRSCQGTRAMDDWEARVRPADSLAADDLEARVGAAMDYWEARPGGSGGAFIVSGTPIPGRNCPVVTSGLPDLMEALKTGTER